MAYSVVYRTKEKKDKELRQRKWHNEMGKGLPYIACFLFHWDHTAEGRRNAINGRLEEKDA